MKYRRPPFTIPDNFRCKHLIDHTPCACRPRPVEKPLLHYKFEAPSDPAEKKLFSKPELPPRIIKCKCGKKLRIDGPELSRHLKDASFCEWAATHRRKYPKTAKPLRIEAGGETISFSAHRPITVKPRGVRTPKRSSRASTYDRYERGTLVSRKVSHAIAIAECEGKRRQ